MDKINIEGGQALKGTVEISGAKNSVLPILAATLLTDEKCVIKNIPPLKDCITMVRILKELGAKTHWCETKREIIIETRGLKNHVAPYSLVSKMRASFCVLGPLLGKLKRAQVSLPGGCVIGPRPVDLHIKGIKALGVDVKIDHGYVFADGRNMRGGRVYLGGAYGSSVLATGNVMMAATLAKGKTVIENAASEPEVIDLAEFLIKMGAKIKGHKTHTIEIEGVKKLGGATHAVIPDRIEAGTYMVAAAITNGDVTIKNVVCEHMGAVIDKLQEAGVKITRGANSIRVCGRAHLKPVDVTTLSYPGFPTDMQAQMMTLMSITEGISVITEKIYPDRFMHVSELNRMGAQVMIEGSSAIIKGVKNLSGAPVMASDLRASAALVLAGLVAKGKTEVFRVYHLDRGYERVEEKLSALGARIWREKEK